MREALVHTAEERFTRQHLLGIVVLFGFLRFALHADVTMLASVAGALMLTEAVTILRETPTVDSRSVKAGIGAFVVVGSLVMAYAVATDDWSGALWVPALTTIAGGWFLVDAAADFRTGREPERADISSTEAVTSMAHAHLVSDELEAGPRTVEGLARGCDLTESRVRDALDLMERNGTVERHGDEYVLNERPFGPAAFVGSLLANAASRFVRPFREFA